MEKNRIHQRSRNDVGRCYNYHSTRHTSTIRLVDYVFCYLFPDDLVNFLPRFYAFTKRDKIAIKMGGNFKCCFNYFWIGVRSDFDRF